MCGVVVVVVVVVVKFLGSAEDGQPGLLPP
jgi:hypothetical protein